MRRPRSGAPERRRNRLALLLASFLFALLFGAVLLLIATRSGTPRRGLRRLRSLGLSGLGSGLLLGCLTGLLLRGLGLASLLLLGLLLRGLRLARLLLGLLLRGLGLASLLLLSLARLLLLGLARLLFGLLLRRPLHSRL